MSNCLVRRTGSCLIAILACRSVIFLLDIWESNSSVRRTSSRLTAVPACKSVIFFGRLGEQQLSTSNRFSSDSYSGLQVGDFFWTFEGATAQYVEPVV